MKIEKDFDLTKLNTFGVKAQAKFFAEVKNEEDLVELFNTPEFRDNQRLFLGGGSNVLFTKNFEGIVVLNRMKGMNVVKEDEENVFIKSMGGEFWHDLVKFTVERGLWGIENLAFIPGTVGAAPVQNIGAYGVELKDTLENVEAYDIDTGKQVIFYKDECEFGYRSSIFKGKYKGKYFISSLVLKLSKRGKGNTDYKILRDYLEENKIKVETSRDISEAVTAIRKSKLPDPILIGNAGSFFKNVFVDREELESLRKTYPEVPSFEEEGIIKIPAGWLIEKCGPRDGTNWKGYREGNIGVHEKQALVLVNYGGATGEEIKNLSEKIIFSVSLKFGLLLEREVNLI